MTSPGSHPPGPRTPLVPRKGELEIDPRGVIFEAYRMELGIEDCRTIFLDWALGQTGPAGPDEVRLLLDHYGPLHPDHPMTAVLRAALVPSAGEPGRRGGRRRRPRSDR